MSVRQLGLIGLIGVVYTVAAVGALHLLDPEVGIVEGFISEYALGDYGWLMRSAFFAAGLGTLAIALGLRQSLPRCRRAALAAALMAVAALGFVVAGIFDADTADASGKTTITLPGVIHDTSTFVLFLGVIVAAFLLHGLFAREPRWRALSPVALWFAVAMTVSRLVMLVVPADGPGGLSQRVFTALLMIWLAVLGWGVRRSARHPS
jgi:hypothetical membrane protein